MMRQMLRMVALMIGLLTAGQAEAAMVVQFSSANLGEFGSGTLGFSFTTSSAVTLADLDYLGPGASGGAVRLYNAAGTTLASATVLATDPTESTGGFTYNVHALAAPLVLAADRTYFVAGDLGGTLPPVDVQGLTVAGGITYNGGVFSTTVGTNPTTDTLGGIFNPAYFLVDFDLAPTAAVPEPSSLALCGIAGIVGLGVARARRRILG